MISTLQNQFFTRATRRHPACSNNVSEVNRKWLWHTTLLYSHSYKYPNRRTWCRAKVLKAHHFIHITARLEANTPDNTNKCFISMLIHVEWDGNSACNFIFSFTVHWGIWNRGMSTLTLNEFNSILWYLKMNGITYYIIYYMNACKLRYFWILQPPRITLVCNQAT